MLYTGTASEPHVEGLGGDDHLGEHGVGGELGHAAAQLGELPAVVERPQRVQLLQGAQQGLRRRRVHEVEAHQVVDAQALQHQHHVACRHRDFSRDAGC